MLSIIVAVYNVGKYLKRCLDSLANQEYSNYEVILVDDGSSDGSEIICDEYANRYNNFTCLHKENGGVSSARNLGLQEAKGEYVSFVDSDDWVSPNYCQIIVDNMLLGIELLYFQGKHEFADGSSFVNIPITGYFSNAYFCQKGLVSLYKNLINYESFGYTWNKAFRMDKIRNNNITFKSGLSFKEDELFTLEYVSTVKSLKVIEECLYNYRVLFTGLTNKRKKSIDFLSLYESESLLLSNYSQPDFLSLQTTRCLFYYTMGALKANWKMSFKLFKKCLSFKTENSNWINDDIYLVDNIYHGSLWESYVRFFLYKVFRNKSI